MKVHIEENVKTDTNVCICVVLLFTGIQNLCNVVVPCNVVVVVVYRYIHTT